MEINPIETPPVLPGAKRHRRDGFLEAPGLIRNLSGRIKRKAADADEAIPPLDKIKNGVLRKPRAKFLHGALGGGLCPYGIPPRQLKGPDRLVRGRRSRRIPRCRRAGIGWRGRRPVPSNGNPDSHQRHAVQDENQGSQQKPVPGQPGHPPAPGSRPCGRRDVRDGHRSALHRPGGNLRGPLLLQDVIDVIERHARILYQNAAPPAKPFTRGDSAGCRMPRNLSMTRGR